MHFHRPLILARDGGMSWQCRKAVRGSRRQADWATESVAARAWAGGLVDDWKGSEGGGQAALDRPFADVVLGGSGQWTADTPLN